MDTSNYCKHCGISKKIYESYGVYGREPDGEPFQLLFPYSDGSLKRFSPRGNNWDRVGNKKAEVVCPLFGYHRLPENGEKVIITATEIDVLTFAEMGIQRFV